MAHDDRYQHIARLFSELSEKAKGFTPTRIPLLPEPGDIRETKNDITIVASWFDEILRAYGQMLVAHGMSEKDMTYFVDRMEGDLQGNCLYCVDELAEQLEEKMLEGVA